MGLKHLSVATGGWSPDQAAGWLRIAFLIYQLIAEDRARGGDLRLRRKGRKRRMKTDAGRMPNRVGIALRPAIVDEKSRAGDWEVDLIVGKQHKGYLPTLVERKTKLLLMSQLANKQADMVRRAIVRLQKPYTPWVHTNTADNGAEFGRHGGFAMQLVASVHYADPYTSWQRGLSEHTNVLVREDFPKGGAPLPQTLNTFFNKNQTHNHPETWTVAFHNSQWVILAKNLSRHAGQTLPATVNGLAINVVSR